FSKRLLPLILQHPQTHTLLMLRYMNQEPYQKTLKQNKLTFFSTSKQRFSTKPQTSAHFQHLHTIHLHSHQHPILIKLIPQPPTSHTPTLTSFNTQIQSRCKIQALAQAIHQT
ncbi:phosphoribosyl-AMP cyclohydrolase, partial [Staphylococcus epidermidis]|uniref:phosphoribosyl-AMP cyclohydrolase n=1 Tax=Staphylococcus epidermidis TaxID=1282 RepID=UPI0028CB9453